MKKTYIIKDARRILEEQIRNNGKDAMNENPITSFQRIMTDIVLSIKWTVRMALGL